MARIEVTLHTTPQGWAADVVVDEKQASTTHHVTLHREDYERLTMGRVSPAELIHASFEFLLEREPKESILREFDLPVIGRYFPEYEREIQRRLTEA